MDPTTKKVSVPVPVFTVPVTIEIRGEGGLHHITDTFLTLDGLNADDVMEKAREVSTTLVTTTRMRRPRRAGSRYFITDAPKIRFGGLHYEKGSITAVTRYETTIQVDYRADGEDKHDYLAVWRSADKTHEAFGRLLDLLNA